MWRKLIKFQFMLASLSAILFSAHQANGHPQSNNANPIPNNLDSIFKIGTGKMVFKAPSHDKSFNSKPIMKDDNKSFNSKPIMKDEKYVIGAGKTDCTTEVSNDSETKLLDQIHPQQFEKFASFFKDDYVPTKNVTNRLDSVDEESYCNSRTRIIYPKGGETRQAKWVLVVQHRQHRQGVLVEQCERESVHCKYSELLPLGISSKCKQHFVYRTMVVYVEGVLKEEMIKLPNYCDCVLQFHPTTRRRH